MDLGERSRILLWLEKSTLLVLVRELLHLKEQTKSKLETCLLLSLSYSSHNPQPQTFDLPIRPHPVPQW